MNKDLMRKCGFNKEMDAVEQNLCPACRQPIGKFRDKLSRREYEISGLCQKCQDGVFGK
jgi:hypothetical protein